MIEPEIRHIVNGCSVNLHQLTARQLDELTSSNRLRAAVLEYELKLLEAESIRRTPLQVPLHSIPTDASNPESSVA